MKVVLIQPKVGFQGASFWEPLGLAYLAAYIHKHRPDVDLEVYSQVFDSENDILAACQDADHVGFGCTTPQMANAFDLNHRIKLLNPGILSTFGGYHPTAMPFETRQFEDVDRVIVGEGEKGMLATINGDRMGICISPPVEDLDSIPFPDRELIHNSRYVQVAQEETGERIASVQASRGCPFRCLPCSNIKMHGSHIRVRSATKVIEEMKLIQQQLNLDFIKFCDATFNTSEERVITFTNEVQNLGLGTPWGCNIHPAIGSFEMFKKMQEAKCLEVWIGVESGSPKILKEQRKCVTVERIKEVFKWTRQLGLIRRAYFLIGSPSETLEDIKMTEKLAEEIDADVYGFTILCPFPRTELYDEQKYKDVDWSKADEYGNTFYRNEAFSNEDLWRIRQELADKFKDKMCWRLKHAKN